MEQYSIDPGIPQKEQFAKKFLEMKKDVTKQDRIDCAKAENLSKITVDRYVNGHVHDNSTAFRIYTFLKNKIDERAAALK